LHTFSKGLDSYAENVVEYVYVVFFLTGRDLMQTENIIRAGRRAIEEQTGLAGLWARREV
jgi:hypothetical protein